MPSSERQPFVFGRTAIMIAGLVLVPTAVPASAATAKRGPVGTMTRTAGTVVIDGKVKRGRTNLRNGSIVRTLESGQGQLQLKVKKTLCDVYPGVKLKIAPSSGVAFTIMKGSRTDVECGTDPSPRRLAFKTSSAVVTATDPVFAIAVGKSGTIVKVGRGFVIVTGRHGAQEAVVARPRQQTLVPAGGDPRAPAPARLTTRDRAAFSRLAARLPPRADRTPPTVTIAKGPEGSLAKTTATFELVASESQVTFLCALDGSAFQPCSPIPSYANLAEGAHTFSARAIDVAGNLGPPSSRSWTIDTTAPTAAVLSGPSDLGASTSAIFTFTANETGVTFRCRLDAEAFTACSSPQTYTGLSEGHHQFSVLAVDAAGNRGVAATYSWTILLPDLVISDIRPGSVTVTNQGAGVAAPFSVRVQPGNTVYVFRAVHGLQPNAQATFTFSPYYGVIEAVADVNGEVDESVETNNSRTVNFTPG
jgi:hypothetical protein